jgi:hypothetical protein
MAPDPQTTFFFYGTLMAAPILSRVLFGSSKPDALSTTHRILAEPLPAMLNGYQRSRVRHVDYPAIIPKSESNACVRGTVVTGLNQGDTWRLDVFEGDEYERRTVKVEILKKYGASEEKKEWDVQTYVWIAGEHRLESEEWDFDVFVKEKLWRWSGEKSNVEGEYTGKTFLKRREVNTDMLPELDVVVGNDPTGGRHVDGGSITDVLKDNDLQKNGDRTNAYVRGFNE